MFEKIIAQNKAKKIISDQIKNNKIPHAYIFVGEDGIGKTLTAVEFAKILNCTINDYTKTDTGACGHCASCRQIDIKNFPDLHMINFEMQEGLDVPDSEKPKNKLGTALIKEMNRLVYMKGSYGKYKFFIVEQAEKMTSAAFNRLLKTYEEPPENTVIILIAKHRETIPITILSRAQTIFFQPLPKEEIAKYLVKEHSLSEETALQIANSAEGSIEKAEAAMLNTQNEYSSLWLELSGKKLAASDILAKSKSVSKTRETAAEAIDIIIENATKNFRREPEIYGKVMEKLLTYRHYLEQNINPNNVTDNLFFDINTILKK